MLAIELAAVEAVSDTPATAPDAVFATPAFIVAAEASALMCAVVTPLKMSLILAPSLAAVVEAVLASLAAVEATAEAELADALLPTCANSLAALAALDATDEADAADVAAVLIATLTLSIAVFALINEPSLG